MPYFDYLGASDFSALGEPVLIVDATSWRAPVVPVQAVVIGIDHAGTLPEVAVADFDVLLTSVPNPPAPWVAAKSAPLEAAVRANPLAATILCKTLRLAEQLEFADGLAVESLGYSTLLGGSEFRRWKPDLPPLPTPLNPVVVDRDDDGMTITLSDPYNQNATTAQMRDALYEALANACDDPSAPHVTLKGAGKCFSTGGALAEFGTAQDLAEAHVVRTARSCALLLHRLGSRAKVELHGACVGAGIEIAAAAAQRVAAPGTWFQLPEVTMGLIPGAGGTVSVSQAIGRHRAAWLMLSGKRISAQLALEWGLIHAIA